MSELSSLKTRVGDATGRLVAAHETRRAQNETLMRALGDLEARFQAQEEELGYYRGRLVPLEEAAMTLTALLDRLIALADGVDGRAANAGLYRAATAARELVELTAELEAARAATAARPEAADGDDDDRDPIMAFEDLTRLELDDELMSEAGEALDLPEPVAQAAAAAAAAGRAGPTQVTEADIRALIARVEQAARNAA